jgi:hypothetical protein
MKYARWPRSPPQSSSRSSSYAWIAFVWNAAAIARAKETPSDRQLVTMPFICQYPRVLDFIGPRATTGHTSDAFVRRNIAPAVPLCTVSIQRQSSEMIVGRCAAPAALTTPSAATYKLQKIEFCEYRQWLRIAAVAQPVGALGPHADRSEGKAPKSKSRRVPCRCASMARIGY